MALQGKKKSLEATGRDEALYTTKRMLSFKDGSGAPQVQSGRTPSGRQHRQRQSKGTNRPASLKTDACIYPPKPCPDGQ